MFKDTKHMHLASPTAKTIFLYNLAHNLVPHLPLVQDPFTDSPAVVAANVKTNYSYVLQGSFNLDFAGNSGEFNMIYQNSAQIQKYCSAM